MNRIKSLFSSLKNNPAPKAETFSDKEIASAALLVEAAHMDGNLDQRETDVITNLLISQFHLSAEEAKELFERAHSAQEDATHLMRFTRTIKDNYSEDERITMIEMMWDVAFADGIIHDFEENLIRRVAGLIYVSDRARGEAKKRAQARIEDAK